MFPANGEFGRVRINPNVAGEYPLYFYVWVFFSTIQARSTGSEMFALCGFSALALPMVGQFGMAGRESSLTLAESGLVDTGHDWIYKQHVLDCRSPVDMVTA
ncbi:hypothetical protein DJ031_11915 [bacterium endosymbiont of Escarpia laminata]|nr:MAG: hypothetical protein DJ031_11915 [bacterium endosymbiont of Escarpia laminata]